MKRFIITMLIIGLTMSSSLHPFYRNDPGANVVGTTATGAVIGGVAGGGRGAAIGAGVGLGLGLLSNAAYRSPEERARERMEQQRRAEDRLNTLYDQHDRLAQENSDLVQQLKTAGMSAEPFRSNLESERFSSAESEASAVKREIKRIKKENKALSRRLRKKR